MILGYYDMSQFIVNIANLWYTLILFQWLNYHLIKFEPKYIFNLNKIKNKQVKKSYREDVDELLLQAI